MIDQAPVRLRSILQLNLGNLRNLKICIVLLNRAVALRFKRSYATLVRREKDCRLAADTAEFFAHFSLGGYYVAYGNKDRMSAAAPNNAAAIATITIPRG
jgi:hypothetical protein